MIQDVKHLGAHANVSPIVLDVRTILILWNPQRTHILLLKRSPNKALLPNLITGVGGKVELEKGEGNNITAAMYRVAIIEETKIKAEEMNGVRPVLTTVDIRGSKIFQLHWFVGVLNTIPCDLSCTEGVLNWYDPKELPLVDFTPAAAVAIPFALSRYDDGVHYAGVLVHEREGGMRLITECDIESPGKM